MKSALLILVASLSLATVSNAQKRNELRIRLEEGSVEPLRNEKTILAEYDYSNMIVGESQPEAEYISKTKAKMNEKEPGKGDEWESEWLNNRKELYHPKFEAGFAKHSKNWVVGNFPDAKYTIILRVLQLRGGFNASIIMKNASIIGEILFVETANHENVIAKYSYGITSYDPLAVKFSTSKRLESAYNMLGWEFGAKFRKAFK